MLVQLNATKAFQSTIISHSLALPDYGETFIHALRHQCELSLNHKLAFFTLIIRLCDEG